jgi:serine protease inhibitor
MKMKAIGLRTLMAAGGGLFLLLGASPPPPGGAEISELGKRINAFTFDVLRQSARGEDAASNAVLSPQSIYHGLAMNYIASGGETRKELAEACHFPEDNRELLEGLTELRGQLHAGAKHERVDMSMANSMWLDEIYISEIHHDAWIEVGEKGVEAAAATATVNRSFGCSAALVPAPASFHADHPFVFTIVHKQSGSMLFGGWISSPPATAGLP